MLATDAAGEVKWSAEYRPFGGVDQSAADELAAENNTRWYTGHEHDADTDLTYMQARFYDPEIGRFMSIDPVGFVEGNPTSYGRYTYANNSPYGFVDPDGQEAIAIDVGFIGVTIGTDDFNAGVPFYKVRVGLVGLGGSIDMQAKFTNADVQLGSCDDCSTRATIERVVAELGVATPIGGITAVENVISDTTTFESADGKINYESGPTGSKFFEVKPGFSTDGAAGIDKKTGAPKANKKIGLEINADIYYEYGSTIDFN